MNYVKSYKLFRTCVMFGFLLFVVYVFTNNPFMGLGAIALIVFAWGQSLIFYRCPNCKKWLIIVRVRPAACHKCGYELDWK